MSKFNLSDYLNAYKECFEAMNKALVEVSKRVEFTDEEEELLRTASMKYRNMLYHIRKQDPTIKGWGKDEKKFS